MLHKSAFASRSNGTTFRRARLSERQTPMIRLVFVLCVLASVAACDSGGSTRATEPSPSPAGEAITVGEQVKRTFTGRAFYFDLAVPKKGFLVVALTWDGTQNGTALVLNLDGGDFRYSGPAGRFPVHLTGTLQVAAGQTVRIAVIGGGTDVFYNDPFVLAVTLQ